jgi:hypothetical protein
VRDEKDVGKRAVEAPRVYQIGEVVETTVIGSCTSSGSFKYPIYTHRNLSLSAPFMSHNIESWRGKTEHNP